MNKENIHSIEGGIARAIEPKMQFSIFNNLKNERFNVVYLRTKVMKAISNYLQMFRIIW